MHIACRISFRMGGLVAATGAAFGALSEPTAAEVPIERPGRVEALPEPFDPHWLLVTDLLEEKASLVDLDEGGGMLGMVATGYGAPEAVFAPGRSEMITPETHFSRTTRGDRTDVVVIRDVATLAPVAEVEIPPRRAMNTLPHGNIAISDDERFVVVFNLTPATSLSIVDLAQRRFVGELAIPGCSLVYAGGARRFLSICMDGALLEIGLDDRGAVVMKRRHAPFFDPEADPITEKGVRAGDRWIFVSFAGRVHVLDVSGATVGFGEPWLLGDLPEGDRAWRIGGIQHLAVHGASNRLYSLMHRGGPDSHKQSGTEVWVHDLADRRRIQRIELKRPGLTVLGESLEFGQGWVWPFRGLYDGVLGMLPDLDVDSIHVTQDAEPLLAAGSLKTGSLSVHDARTGEFLRRVTSGTFTTHSLQAPFGASGWAR